MRPFVITTDSNSDLPVSYIQAHSTTIIPQYYSFGDTVYGDELNMEPSEFYERMKNGELPGSQANNPAVIRDRFEALLQKGYDILRVAFSSALSGSYNNVCVTARDLMDDYPDSRIVVIDSLNVSLSEAIMVMQGDLYREAGHTLEETAAFLEEFKTHMNVQFTVDDLFHLQRGGRVSKTTAVVGSALNLKPFLYVNAEGKLTSAGTVRGRKKSLRKLVDRMKETLPEHPDYSIPVGIVHGNCLEDAKLVADYVRSETGFTDIIIPGPSASCITETRKKIEERRGKYETGS